MESRRVLVIEDDPAVRLALEVFLSAEVGVGEVNTAADGDEGAAFAGSFCPHVIVTDSTMPGVSGDELGRSLRASCPEATIISFSGVLNDAPWADHRIQKGGPDTFDALAAAVSGAPIGTVKTKPAEVVDLTTETPTLPQEDEHRRRLHDLRNFLTPLAGYASLLEANADEMDAQQVKEIADRMQKAIDRVLGALKEL
jgi:CheY-like chemotaxis protein